MSLMGFGLYTVKDRKKARAARLCALFIITAYLLSFTLSTAHGVVLDEEKDKEAQQDAPKDALSKFKEDANPPSMYAPGGIVLDEKGNKETPLYAPGEVIIKLKDNRGGQGRLSAMPYSERAQENTSTLSILKSKYNLHSEEPLFKGLHNQLKAHNLSVKQLAAQNEAKSQQEPIKPSQDLREPDIFPIYILKTDEDVLAACARLKEDPNVEYA